MRELIVETTNLVKCYGDQVAVDKANLHIQKGTIYGILGRNGAGKTTIMEMILGLRSITSGEIFVFGKALKDYQKEIYPRIGVMIDSLGFYPNLTASENLQVFSKLRGSISRHAIKNALDIAGLPFRDKKPYSQFSLGMKQRMGFANAIIHDPELLILDEPTNGLDPAGIVEMRNYIKALSAQQGKTILISSHILSEIALLADDIGIIHNGQILEQCSYSELQNRKRQYILLQVSVASVAARVLEQELGITDYIIEDDSTIRLFDSSHNTRKINKVLYQNNISVMGIQALHESLEDYFKKLTGGERIG